VQKVPSSLHKWKRKEWAFPAMQACINHRCRFCSPACALLRPRRRHPSVAPPRLHPHPPRIPRPRTRSSPVRSAVATPRAEHQFGVWTSIRQRRTSIRQCAARFVGAEHRFDGVLLDSSAPSIDSMVCCSIRRCRTSICTAGGCPAAKLARMTCCSPSFAVRRRSRRDLTAQSSSLAGKGRVWRRRTPPRWILGEVDGSSSTTSAASGVLPPALASGLPPPPTPLSWRTTTWWSRSSRSRGVAVEEQGREE
jgi:hypothetical protein